MDYLAQPLGDGILSSLYMTDLIVIGIICIAWPVFGRIIEHYHVRRIKAGVPGARKLVYLVSLFDLVLIAALSLFVWTLPGRSIADLGFTAADGWADIAVYCVIAVALAYYAFQISGILFSERIRGMWQQALGEAGERVPFLPASTGDATMFGTLGVTAGITEEIIFRGFLINAFALVMPLWAGGALSLLVFVILHAYQGKQGMMQVAVIGTVITGLYLAGASLWSLIALHIILDVLAASAMAVAHARPAPAQAAEGGAGS